MIYLSFLFIYFNSLIHPSFFHRFDVSMQESREVDVFNGSQDLDHQSMVRCSFILFNYFNDRYVFYIEESHLEIMYAFESENDQLF